MAHCFLNTTPNILEKTWSTLNHVVYFVLKFHGSMLETVQLATSQWRQGITGTSAIAHPVNTLRPIQNGRHFPDNNFKCIFLDEDVWISVKISLIFVPNGPIYNIPAMVQIMTWRRPGDKPLSEPTMVSSLRHSASMSQLMHIYVYNSRRSDGAFIRHKKPCQNFFR